MKTAVQSVILPKSKYTEKQANNWINKNGFRDYGKRIKNYKTTNFYRFRQLPPSYFKDYRDTYFEKFDINVLKNIIKEK